jgi:hypothetical protein
VTEVMLLSTGAGVGIDVGVTEGSGVGSWNSSS